MRVGIWNGMAVSCSSTPCIPWLRHPTTTQLGISKGFSTATKSPKIPSVSISARITLRRATLSASFNLLPTSATLVVRGLPLSTSEGRLMKSFSGFGEVTQVKLLVDKESGQSLGCAYIWFVKEESAQWAVKEMNGKFFDGRFIHVTTAKPGSSTSWKKATPYKF